MSGGGRRPPVLALLKELAGKFECADVLNALDFPLRRGVVFGDCKSEKQVKSVTLFESRKHGRKETRSEWHTEWLAFPPLPAKSELSSMSRSGPDPLSLSEREWESCLGRFTPMTFPPASIL